MGQRRKRRVEKSEMKTFQEVFVCLGGSGPQVLAGGFVFMAVRDFPTDGQVITRSLCISNQKALTSAQYFQGAFYRSSRYYFEP